MSSNVYWHAAAALAEPDAVRKAALTQSCYAAWRAGQFEYMPTEITLIAGRPTRPHLVRPEQLSRRKLGSLEGRAALIHAICHIEFNAINLALDAACRFLAMPAAYFDDWLQVASEEAGHFLMLNDHLKSMGYAYGDFSAHNGLWEMAEKTQCDVLDRMAMVPRLLEARGLDVTPGMQARLLAAGDAKAVALLDIIFRDEVGHVSVGNRWFRYLCRERGLAPLTAFRDRLITFNAPRHKGEMNIDARIRAGFVTEELQLLAGWAESPIRQGN